MYESQDQQSQSNSEMTSSDIIQQLEAMKKQIIQQQRNALAQVLSLQKILNKLLSTSIIRQKPQNQSKKQLIQEPKQFNIEKVNQKIKSIIDDTEEINIEADQPIKLPKKQPIQQKPNLPNPVIKKPPIPTANRVSNVNKISTVPRFIPPRNNSQVTGKVTQTKIITQQKVFKPQIGKTNVNKNQTISIRGQSQKKLSVKQTSTLQSSLSKKQLQQPPNLPSSLKSNNLDNDKNGVSEYKQLRSKNQMIRLKSFSKTISDLVQQVSQKKQTKKKLNFKQLIQRFQKQHMGYKNQQQKRRNHFLKHFNNFSMSLKKYAPEVTHSIPLRSWEQYPFIFGYNEILDSLQGDIEKIEIALQEDCRISSEEVYKAKIRLDFLGEQLHTIMATSQAEKPAKIELSFKKKLQHHQSQSMLNSDQNPLSYDPFYQKLGNVLKSIKSKESLAKEELSKLRYLNEIVEYQGKRAPIITMVGEYEEWIQYYQEEEEH